MKNILTLSAIVASAFVFGQSGIKFEDTNFKATLEKAKKENKLIFLDAYTTWCGPCKLMSKNIFPLESVGNYYNANFVNAKIDMEKGEGIDIAKKYGVKAFPTYLFIDGNGNEIHRTIGYVEENDFIQFGKDAQDPSKRTATLIKRFEDGEKDPEFLKNLAGLTVYTNADLFGKIVGRYIDGKKGQELSKEDLNMLLAGVNSTDSPAYKIFKDRKAEIEKAITPEKYSKIDTGLLLKNAYKANFNKDTKVLNEKQYQADIEKFLPKEGVQKALLGAKLSAAFSKKDFATWQNLMFEKYKDVSNVDSQELNSISWTFFENITDKKGLEKAISWAQESVKKDQQSHNTDTLANLYNKIGDKQNAKIWALKSIELAKATGQDYSDTQKILDSIK